MAARETPCRIAFDRFVVDASRRQLTRDRTVVPLNSKTFDLLLALLERRGELITKDELFERVWPNQSVEEGNLTVHVSGLRKALGERPGEHRFIVTVPGRGYSFVATVDEDTAATIAAQPAPLRARLRRLPVRRDLAGLMALAVVVLVSAAYWRATNASTPDASRVPSTMTTRLLTAVGNVSSAVLSPDGKYFAYVAFQDGAESLWLGHVDGTEAAQIRPPDDVDYQSLTFAPKGERIFYTARGALYQVPVPGGSTQKVLDGVSGGFALSPDATRVAFVRRRPDTTAFAIVVADLDGGGREREVTSLPAGRSFSSYGPAWSPDGATLAVGVTAATPSRRLALTSVRVADGALTPLSRDEWDDIGKIAWAHDGSGFLFNAVGVNSDFHIWFFDIASGRLRCVTPDLSRYGRASVSVSDDGRSLLAVRGEINSTVWVAPVRTSTDPRPITSRAFGKLDGSAGVAWTPEGDIVYVSFFNNSYSIWRTRDDGAHPQQLTSAGHLDRFPQVAADGRSIVFESNRGGGSDIWRIDADGGRLRQLTTGGHSSQPALTPDSRWVLYTATVDGTDAILKMPIDGGTAVRVTHGPSGWPSVSPDGRLVAIASSSDNPQRALRLAILSVENGTVVAEFEPARGGRLTNGLRWSPDGSAVMYRDFSQGVWQQPIAGGPPQKSAVAPHKRIYVFDWSKDARQIAMSYGDEVRDVVLMNGFR